MQQALFTVSFTLLFKWSYSLCAVGEGCWSCVEFPLGIGSHFTLHIGSFIEGRDRLYQDTPKSYFSQTSDRDQSWEPWTALSDAS